MPRFALAKKLPFLFDPSRYIPRLHLQLMLGARDGLTDAARACVLVLVRVSVHVRV